MQNPRLATRYAKSLLDLTIERDSLDSTLADMQLLNKICHQNHDFVNMLRSPIINSDKKKAIINEIFTGRISELTNAFVILLITKGRESNLQEISTAFITQYNKIKKITIVNLTSASALPDKLKDAIISKVKEVIPDESIELNTNVDNELIGGFVLEVSDKIYDASVKKSLMSIRAKIVDNSYISKI